MQYGRIFEIFLLFILITALPVMADEDGRRFMEGNLDAETALMLNVPPDSTKTASNIEQKTSSIADDKSDAGIDANTDKETKRVSVVSDSDEARPVTDSEEMSELKIDSDESGVDEKTLLAYIPEHEFNKDGRQRRELTEELAIEFPGGKFVPRVMTNEAWGVGEELTFQITYGFYQAGTATMAVVEKTDVNGGLCYHIHTQARSNDFISAFYKVRDKVDSYIDVQGIFSRRFEKRLREGKYKSDRMVDFYHDRQLALNTRDKHPFTEIPLYVQDILSSLYYLRTVDFEAGKDHEILTYADGKVYPLKVILHGKETIEVPAGKFTCYKVEPVLKSEGIFRQDGKLTVWLTDDQYKMPVKMESKIAIGSIATKLESYERSK